MKRLSRFEKSSKLHFLAFWPSLTGPLNIKKENILGNIPRNIPSGRMTGWKVSWFNWTEGLYVVVSTNHTLPHSRPRGHHVAQKHVLKFLGWVPEARPWDLSACMRALYCFTYQIVLNLLGSATYKKFIVFQFMGLEEPAPMANPSHMAATPGPWA